jgi:hypothetical protein
MQQNANQNGKFIFKSSSPSDQRVGRSDWMIFLSLVGFRFR